MAGFYDAVQKGAVSFIIPEDTNKLSSIKLSGEIKFEELMQVLREIDSMMNTSQFGLFLNICGASSDLCDCNNLDLGEWTFGGKVFKEISSDQLAALLSAIPSKFEFVKIVAENDAKSWCSRKELEDWLLIKQTHAVWKPFFGKPPGPSKQDPEPPQAGMGLAS